MDPLSDVLSLIRPQSHMSAGFDAAGPWSIAFPGQSGTIKTGALVAGSCFVAVEGSAPVRLGPGDAFVLPRGLPFVMASDLALPPTDAQTIFRGAARGGIVTRNGGGEVFLISSRFTLDGPAAEILLAMLPPIVHLGGDAERAALRWAIERTMAELGRPRPGGVLMLDHLAQSMLVEALRADSEPTATERVGWLFALGDRRIGAAIAALHDDPARRWRVDDLAGLVGMSRSSFAERFRRLVGSAPLDYLTRWRMSLAADRLVRSREPLSVVAPALGYESESAFGAAFKRVFGRSPRAFAAGAPPADHPLTAGAGDAGL